VRCVTTAVISSGGKPLLLFHSWEPHGRSSLSLYSNSRRHGAVASVHALWLLHCVPFRGPLARLIEQLLERLLMKPCQTLEPKTACDREPAKAPQNAVTQFLRPPEAKKSGLFRLLLHTFHPCPRLALLPDAARRRPPSRWPRAPPRAASISLHRSAGLELRPTAGSLLRPAGLELQLRPTAGPSLLRPTAGLELPRQPPATPERERQRERGGREWVIG